MARKTASFVDLHIEKVVIGVCAAGLIAAVVLSFGGGRFAVEGQGPAEICKAVGEAAEKTKQAMNNAPTDFKPSGATDSDLSRKLGEWFGDPRGALIKLARVDETLPRAQPFPPPLPSNRELGGDKRNLAQMVAPGIPLAMTGRTRFVWSEPRPVLPETSPPDGAAQRERSVSWVAVGAQVDLVAQEANYIAERYPDRTYPLVVKVHLQRRDVDEPSAGWQDVDPFLPYDLPPRPRFAVTPDGKIVMERLDRYRLVLEASSEEIARPRLPRRVSGDKFDTLPLPYLDDPPKPGGSQAEAARQASKWLRLAKSALEGKRPFDSADPDAALILAQAAAGAPGLKESDAASAKQLLEEIKRKLPKERQRFVQQTLRPPEKLMPLVAYDFSAEPGHQYEYRMRYEVLNIYAGNRTDLLNPRDAEKLTIFSDWSPPTRPILVQSDLYF